MRFNNIVKFFFITFVLTIPSYILVYFESIKIGFTPAKAFPFIAVSALAPILSALILSKERKYLLKKIFDLKNIRIKWSVFTILFFPILFLLIFFILIILGEKIIIQNSIFILISTAVIFFLLSIGEETGWMGYIYGLLENKYGIIKSSFILAGIWSLWHIPFYVFTIKNLIPIIFLILSLVGLRSLMVWLFSKTNNLLTIIIFHTMYNFTIGFIPIFNTNTGIIITSISLLAFSLIALKGYLNMG